MTVSDEDAGRTAAAPSHEASEPTDAEGPVTRADDAVMAEAAVEPSPEAPAAEVPADPHAAPPPPRRGGGFAVFLALLALIVAAAALAGVVRPDWLRLVPRAIVASTAPTSAPSLAPLEQRLAAVESLPAELRTLGEQVAALAAGRVGAAAAADADVSAKLAAVEADATRLAGEIDQALATAASERAALAERIATTTEALAQAAPAARLSALDERIAALEGVQPDTSQSQAVALALVAATLRRVVSEGAVLAKPLAMARAFAGDDAAIAAPLATLDAAATAGVPSEAMLRGELAAIASAVHAATRNAPGRSWAERTLSRLEDALAARRPDPAGAGPEAVLARAQAYLATGDVAGAAAVLGGYAGPGVDAVRTWRDRAGSRTAALAAIASLEARAFERLATGE